MKKVMKRLVAVMAVALMVFAFTACGGEDMSNSPYVGDWHATTAEYSGIEIGVEDVIGGEFVFSLEDNGKCTVSIAGDEESGKWTETEEGFNVEEEFDFVADGDTATLDYEGVTMHFEKK